MGEGPGTEQAGTGADSLVRLVRELPQRTFVDWFRTGLDAATLRRLVAALPPDRQAALAALASEAGVAARGLYGRTQRRPSARPLGAAVRTARTRAGLSQQALAELVGVRQSAVSQWEREAVEPSGRRMASLYRVLPGLAAALDEQESKR